MVDASVPASARFEAAFEAHHRRVLGYAARRTRSLEDAEDVVAETFAIAWRRVGDLPEAETALPWLLGITRRVVANHARGRRRFAGLLDRLRAQPRQSGTPAPMSPATEALARLRPEDQELLRLLAWEGLTQAEAGRVLGVSANAVAIRLHRARKRFVEELAKGSGGSRTSHLVKGSSTGESK